MPIEAYEEQAIASHFHIWKVLRSGNFCKAYNRVIVLKCEPIKKNIYRKYVVYVLQKVHIGMQFHWSFKLRSISSK